jgi:hypothetical protein
MSGAVARSKCVLSAAREAAPQFLLSLATVVLVDVEGRMEVETLPAGELVGVEPGRVPEGKFITVRWRDQEVRMFAEDLRERGIPFDHSMYVVPAPSATPGGAKRR